MIAGGRRAPRPHLTPHVAPHAEALPASRFPLLAGVCERQDSREFVPPLGSAAI